MFCDYFDLAAHKPNLLMSLLFQNSIFFSSSLITFGLGSMEFEIGRAMGVSKLDNYVINVQFD